MVWIILLVVLLIWVEIWIRISRTKLHQKYKVHVFIKRYRGIYEIWAGSPDEAILELYYKLSGNYISISKVDSRTYANFAIYNSKDELLGYFTCNC